METSTKIEEIVAKMEKRKDFVTKELKKCPNGVLSYERTGKTTLLIQETKENEVRHRHKLTRDPDLAAALLRKQALEDENRSLEKNIRMLKAYLYRAEDYSAATEMAKLLKRYPGVDQRLLSAILDTAPANASAWALEDYEQSDYKPEEKRQINSRGLRLRSKSEVILSEMLYEYGLEFRYEQVLWAGSHKLIPDFTIRRSDGKIFIWEHEGLTNVQTYLERQRKKEEIYAKIGFVPWDNLIVTYDNADGIIDLRIAESEIVNKLLI